MKKSKNNNSGAIVAINMNRLNGRMLNYPSKKDKPLNILFIYGQHSSIERWRGFIQFLHDFGNVTVPDLPGFGGMDSFYKINKLPTIDNYASYLDSFIKMKYKKTKLLIVGVDFGFVVATRMLQEYPELSKSVSLVIAIKGYADSEDLIMSNYQKYRKRSISYILSKRVIANIFSLLVIKTNLIKIKYRQDIAGIKKYDAKSQQKLYGLLKSELALWKINDLRSYMFTTNELLSLTNCNKKISVPLWHLVINSDLMIDNKKAEQHIRVIFSNYKSFMTKNGLLPINIYDKRSVNAWMPNSFKRAVRNFSQ